jgi:hypothetical protein
MDFAGDRIFVAGPTTTQQPMPFRPLTAKCLLTENLDGWTREGDVLVSSNARRAKLSMDLSTESFLFECTVRFQEATATGLFTVEIGQDRLELSADGVTATFRSASGKVHDINLSQNFDHSVWHQLVIEKNRDRCLVVIDEMSQSAAIRTVSEAIPIAIVSEGLCTAISAIELTPGFEERFETDEIPGRFRLIGNGIVSDGALTLGADESLAETRAVFAVPFAEFGLAANLSAGDGPGGSYGLRLLDGSGASVAHLTASPAEMKIKLEALSKVVSIDLPDSFVGSEIRQFRLVSQGGRLSAHLDGIFLSDLPFAAEVSEAAIYGTSDISIEMVRLTGL